MKKFFKLAAITIAAICYLAIGTAVADQTISARQDLCNAGTSGVGQFLIVASWPAVRAAEAINPSKFVEVMDRCSP